jgi:hypothetical protein
LVVVAIASDGRYHPVAGRLEQGRLAKVSTTTIAAVLMIVFPSFFRLMTGFGTPRNTSTRVKAENLVEIPDDILMRTHGDVRLQSGTNKYASQRGMTGFGTGRDVCREGISVNQLPADLQMLPEEKIRLSDGIVRLQSGTNKYDSQKGMTGMLWLTLITGTFLLV